MEGPRQDIAPPPYLGTLLPWADAWAQPDFVFGTWAGGETNQGTRRIAYFAFSESARDFLKDVSAGHWVRPDINWSGEEERRLYRHLRNDPEALKSATVDDCADLLTTLVTGDRFNEGMLAKAFADGVIAHALARVKALANAQQ